LKVGNHERRGKNLDAEDALLRRFFQVTGGEPVFAALFECPMNAVENFNQIRAGAAAGIEHVDVLVGKAKRQAQFLAQHGIDALHHVLHNLGRRVPDAKLLAQFGVKGLQEGLVKYCTAWLSWKLLKKEARSTRLSTAPVQS
jgi:hypothetical protein